MIIKISNTNYNFEIRCSMAYTINNKCDYLINELLSFNI